MVANPRGLFMSVEEYLELDSNSLEGRYEYIDGYVYMLAGGTANHSIIGGNLIAVLNRLQQSNSCVVYTSDMRVRLSKKRYVYPDVTVSCDPRDLGEVNTLEHPRLVFEVLSTSTEAYDRGRKFSYYRACPTIQEYVLIDTQRQAVEVFRRETENLWTLHPFGPGDAVELASINVSFPIAALYKNVALADESPADA
ncbi:MAG: Uma2 family endonuclease [Ktedonobacteraceae bacterium]